ncbi:hypothetical protein AYX19_21670 (plasmid) [Paenarthrobacter ureafaciens]|nr:hypothetical protein AYX19_21670 [Paenarthrobacter ureafaciens]
MEVVAECAADAEPSAMSRCFDVAALAVEVDGDLSACRADRLAIGGAQARQEPILEALWAGSAGVHGVVVADVAESAFWPVGCEPGDVPAAASTRIVASARRARTTLDGRARERPAGFGSIDAPGATRRGCLRAAAARCGRARHVRRGSGARLAHAYIRRRRREQVRRLALEDVAQRRDQHQGDALRPLVHQPVHLRSRQIDVALGQQGNEIRGVVQPRAAISSARRHV